MKGDKYSATWVSHSSISDFLKCPRSYYLRNVYKNPKTGKKMTVMTPPLALGQAVHEVIESLAKLPSEERFLISLVKKLDPVWLKVAGKKGGFTSYETESVYRDRAIQMLINVQENPGPLLDKIIKIKIKKCLSSILNPRIPQNHSSSQNTNNQNKHSNNKLSNQTMIIPLSQINIIKEIFNQTLTTNSIISSLTLHPSINKLINTQTIRSTIKNTIIQTLTITKIRTINLSIRTTQLT